MSSTALCIGINDYPGTKSDLFGCVNDAQDWGDVLTQRGFEVSYLLDADATKRRMVDAIEGLILATEPKQTSVITFSGHGSFVPDLDGDEPDDSLDEILCPHDIADGQWISDDELRGLFSRRSEGAHIVFVTDSCHSGTMGRVLPPLVENGPPERVRFLPPAVFLRDERLSLITGVRRPRSTSAVPAPEALVLSGCEDWQTSGDGNFDGRPNGVMTFYALRALNILDSDANYNDWFAGLRKFLPNQREPQSPRMEAPEGQLSQRILTPSQK